MATCDDMDGMSSKADAGQGSAPVSSERRVQLERVLRDALLAKPNAALAMAEVAAMRALAARHHGKPLAVDPIVVDIVAALLSAAFRVRVEDSPSCMEMSRTIANSLWNDPVVRDRIDALWTRLSEQS